MTVPALAERVLAFLDAGQTCLLAGAGVGVRAGLPTWDQYLRSLAEVARPFEAETAAIMLLRIQDRNFPEAAHLYLRCQALPVGEKMRALVAPFLKYDAKALAPLVSLQFRGLITTNFDRALHDAYYSLDYKPHEETASGRAPAYVELGDGSMQSIIYRSDFFIARLHGRAEAPDSIRLATEHFEALQRDNAYHDFLAHVFKTFNTLWVGFSFTDPALTQVLSSLATHLPTPLPGRHLALLPQDADPGLRTKLASWNIATEFYDPAHSHAGLWTLLDDIHHLRRRPTPLPPRDIHAGASTLTRFLASSYARLTLASDILPLRKIVVEGVVSQLISEAGNEWPTPEQLLQQLRALLPIPLGQLQTLLDDALDGLSRAGITLFIEGHVALPRPLPNRLDEAFASFLESVRTRLRVREGRELDAAAVSALRTTLDDLFLYRGFDLGAHFASSGHASSHFAGWADVGQFLLTRLTPSLPSQAAAITRVLIDVFRHPDDTEANLLYDLGRVSFAVEIVFNNANDTVNLNQLLPDVLYLDASVLMPAITDGHPYSEAYSSALRRAQAAAPGHSLSVNAARDFLNEIVTHRRAALTDAKELHFDNPEVLRKHLLFYGATNANVYIAAYASRIRQTGGDVDFPTFLNEVAPFEDEDALEQVLSDRGIRTISLAPRDAKEYSATLEVTEQLLAAYGASSNRPKADVLVAHEARQLVRMRADAERLRKPLFVTADRRLMRACGNAKLAHYGRFLMSERGLLQLVDLLVGIKADKKALARIMWAGDTGDDEMRLRNYLIDLALRRYDDALAMASWEVVEEVSRRAVIAAREQGISLRMVDTKQAGRTTIFLDEFEKDFFANMDEVIRKRGEGL